MAYLIGNVTADEAAELERRGWELETPPPELSPKLAQVAGVRRVMVWVDANLLDVMSGEGWAQ